MATKGVNRATILGFVGKNPEIRYTRQQKVIACLNIATTEIRREPATGETKEKTEWHRVIVFDRTAEIVRDHVVKGMQVFIEGRMETRKWKDDKGNDRYIMEIIVSSDSGTLQMLGTSQKAKPEAAGNTVANVTPEQPISAEGMRQLNMRDFDEEPYPY